MITRDASRMTHNYLTMLTASLLMTSGPLVQRQRQRRARLPDTVPLSTLGLFCCPTLRL